jgi:hypothetical protein
MLGHIPGSDRFWRINPCLKIEIAPALNRFQSKITFSLLYHESP